MKVTKIYKYKIWNPTSSVFPGFVMRADGEFSEVSVPSGAKLLKIGEQEGSIFGWFEVDPNENKVSIRTFQTYGTGDPIEWNMGTDRIYVDSVLMQSGLVWHVFEYTGV